jgi:hypothetical protein
LIELWRLFLKLIFPLLVFSAVLNSGIIEFESAGTISCDGVRIDVGSYSAPLAADWNGDGLKDLICGQFDYGRIRFYPNVGTSTAPIFEQYFYLMDGVTYLSVPYG